MNGVQSQAYTWVVNLQAPFQLSFVCPRTIASLLHEKNLLPQPWEKASLYRTSRPTNQEIKGDLDRGSKQGKTTPMLALNPIEISKKLRSMDSGSYPSSSIAFSKCKQGEKIKCLALSERRYRESSRYPRKESARRFVNESMVRCQVVVVK